MVDIGVQPVQNAVRQLGECCYCSTTTIVDGIVVYTYDRSSGLLFHRGFWLKNANKNNTNTNNLYPPPKVSPGVDMVGILWSEQAASSSRALGRNHGSMLSLRREKADDERSDAIIIWRDLNSLLLDPDTAKQEDNGTDTNSRRSHDRKTTTTTTSPISRLIEAGFTSAAGITFSSPSSFDAAGIVVFLSNQKVEDHIKTTTPDVVLNNILRIGTRLIGDAVALEDEIKKRQHQRGGGSGGVGGADPATTTPAKQQQPDETSSNKNNKNNNNGALSTTSMPQQKQLDEEVAGIASTTIIDDNKQHNNYCCDDDGDDNMQRHPYLFGLSAWARKTKGGNLQIPPPMSTKQSLFTVFGCFVGLLSVSLISVFFKKVTNDNYWLITGPFGALITLQYALTAAPAAQPRNAILGQIVVGAVTLPFTYIPEQYLPIWLRRAVGPAFAIGAMAKLGIVHPPAGAHAVQYASGDFNWGFYGIVVLATILTVIPAVFVNNINPLRQHPTYWGLIPFKKTIMTNFCTGTAGKSNRTEKDGEE